MPKTITIYSLSLVLISLICNVQAANNIALIIGNSNYSIQSGYLRNPINDAIKINKALTDLDFETIYAPNVSNLQEMEDKVKEFSKRAKNKEIALFYYAGHAVQLNDANYLIPTQARIDKAHETKYKAMNVNYVMDELNSVKHGLTIVVLDACRDNPFPKDTRSGATRGLAKLTTPRSTLIAYSTEPGKTAPDGDKDNSPYAIAFLDALQNQAKLPVNVMFNQISIAVEDASYNKQSPRLEMSSIRGQYCFSSCQHGSIPEDELSKPNIKPSSSEYYTNSIGMKFKYIAGGPFYQGSCQSGTACPSGAEIDSNAQEDETPQHSVTISNGFQMGVHEVTVAQFKKFIYAAQRKDLLTEDFKKYNSHSDNAAVSWVSWEDAQLFINWLNNKEGGKRYRLPTEAEWEYAARAGSKSRYSWGNREDKAGAYAWYDKNAYDKGEKYAQVVGGKQPNAWGLYDMHGNVWEWVQDWYDRNYYDEVTYSTSKNDPKGSDSGRYRVIRGGSWNSYARNLRSAYRYYNSPGSRYYNVGFRLLRKP